MLIFGDFVLFSLQPLLPLIRFLLSYGNKTIQSAYVFNQMIPLSVISRLSAVVGKRWCT